MAGADRDKQKGLSEAAGKSTAGSLEGLCILAAQLFEMDAAAVLIKQDNVSRLVASHGLPVAMRSHTFNFDNAPYAPNDQYVLANASGKGFAQALFSEFGFSPAGALLRIPIEVTERYSLSLMIFGKTPIVAPTKRKLKLVEELAELAKVEFRSVVQLLADPDNDVTVPRTLDEIKVMARQYPSAAFLLDSKLRVIESNQKGADIAGISLNGMIGLTHSDLSTATADAVNFLYYRALETGVSPPDFEIVLNGKEGPRLFRMNVTPFSPTDTRQYFLFVAVTETTALARRALALETAITVDAPALAPKDPSQMFLMDTLVRRRTIRQRKAANYLVLRAWRQSIKSYQISALKALKQNIPPDLPSAIASEIAGEVDALFGRAGFKAIVPVPCGHSRGPSCLSLEIARARPADRPARHTGIHQ
jgi:PAS domain-containing protein